VKVAGSHRLPVAPETAYRLLQDPAVLARCLPGCQELVREGEDTYRMKMNVALAAISGQFESTVRLAEPNFPASFRLIVDGTGRIGFLKGDGLLRLSPDGGATVVAYDGEVHVGGAMAGVGQRLLDATAKMIIRRFFEKLSSLAACPPR
jgi:carbon monoxide dehydrogenase subunit G